MDPLPQALAEPKRLAALRRARTTLVRAAEATVVDFGKTQGRCTVLGSRSVHPLPRRAERLLLNDLFEATHPAIDIARIRSAVPSDETGRRPPSVNFIEPLSTQPTADCAAMVVMTTDDHGVRWAPPMSTTPTTKPLHGRATTSTLHYVPAPLDRSDALPRLAMRPPEVTRPLVGELMDLAAREPQRGRRRRLSPVSSTEHGVAAPSIPRPLFGCIVVVT